MRIAIGSDHTAVEERAALQAHLEAAGHTVLDQGCEGTASVDYPDYAGAVAQAVQRGDAERGLLLCGTGIGVCMAAGKVPGVRAATVHNEWTAEMTRRHNDAHIACMGVRLLSTPAILRITDAFLAAPFDGGRHEGRVSKIMAWESCTPEAKA